VSEITKLREIGQNEKPETRWIMLIKELRAMRGCSISEAKHAILSDPVWRRWAVYRANRSSLCAKEANWYIRDIGSNSFVTKDGSQFFVRRQDLRDKD
jgi:hypothetical protein